MLQDQSAQIAAYRDSLEFDPGRLEGIEERLFLINKVKSKYGGSVEAALDYLEQARGKKPDWKSSNSSGVPARNWMTGRAVLCSSLELSARRREGAKTLQRNWLKNW